MRCLGLMGYAIAVIRVDGSAITLRLRICDAGEVRCLTTSLTATHL
ncbi:hypothetical protein [[Scytonema hofmanni] UTEX B 1581]|nr:hypothetical protein [[Scytonema hofmanni] UTEX B 1581]